MMKIIFLVRSLECGGAERQLTILAKQLLSKQHDVTVAVFYSGGSFERDLFEAGVKVKHLDKKSRWDVINFILNLIYWLRSERPDILQTYLCTENIVAALIKPLIKRPKLVWGIRSTNMSHNEYSILSRLLYRVEPFFSSIPDAIISNSVSGYEYAKKRGFFNKKIKIIHNGIDTNRFINDRENSTFRQEFNIAEDIILIASIARIDPIKGHLQFLDAIQLFLNRTNLQKVRFVVVGSGETHYYNKIREHAKKLGIEEYIIWTGLRTDIVNILSSIDIFTSHSLGEGFSNTICEALSCEITCVVSDVGDNELIVGNEGIIVRPMDAEKLAKSWQYVMEQKDKSHLKRGRYRMISDFSIERMVEKTEDVYKECVK